MLAAVGRKASTGELDKLMVTMPMLAWYTHKYSTTARYKLKYRCIGASPIELHTPGWLLPDHACPEAHIPLLIRPPYAKEGAQ